jgi:hypothetical protein
MITANTLTDEQIRVLRDGPLGLSDEHVKQLCRVALQSGEPTGKHPFCRVCSWRKGGVDSWDGKACKCGLREEMYHRCDRCGGVGRVSYDLGSVACSSCDGSGLVSPADIRNARARCAEMLNVRAQGAR